MLFGIFHCSSSDGPVHLAFPILPSKKSFAILLVRPFAFVIPIYSLLFVKSRELCGLITPSREGKLTSIQLMLFVGK
jgi:hypothetical protein